MTPIRKTTHVVTTTVVTERGKKPMYDFVRTCVNCDCGAQLWDSSATEEEVKALIVGHKLEVIAARLGIEFVVMPVEEVTLPD